MLCFVGNDFLKSRFFHGDIFINSHLWEGNYIICLCTVLSLVDKTFELVLTDKTMTFYDRRKDNQLNNILQHQQSTLEQSNTETNMIKSKEK